MRHLLLAAGLCLAAPPVLADQYSEVMTGYVHDHILGWAGNPLLIQAIRAQNLVHANLAQAEIDELDRLWRLEVGKSDQPTIRPVVTGPVADFLRRQISASDGVMTEVFVMDERGLNVAASDITSDFWQGDEAKFSESYGLGAGAVHIGDIEYDESTQSYQGQVSVAIADPDTGAPIGAVTVGLNAEMLF